VRARRVKGLDPDAPLAVGARRIALVRLGELQAFDPAIRDPAEVEALHDMRIAAKRLRYILELTEPALGPVARTGAKEAKNLQGLLGDIHDCDEMLPLVRGHVKRLRHGDAAALRDAAGSRAKDLAPSAASSAPSLKLYRGLEALIVWTEARREVLYRRFLVEWDRLERGGFREKMEEGLTEDARATAPERANGSAPANV